MINTFIANYRPISIVRLGDDDGYIDAIVRLLPFETSVFWYEIGVRSTRFYSRVLS